MIITLREKPIEEKVLDIEAKYNSKFEGLQKRLTAVTLSDGTAQVENTVTIQNEYKALADQMDIEIIELLGGI